MRHCTLKVISPDGKRVFGFVSFKQHTELKRPARISETNYSSTLAPWILSLPKQSLEIFLIGYSIYSMVPIGPVHVISLLSGWVTRPLITTVLGLGREDFSNSLLRPSKGVVASPSLLDKLLLYSAVKF
jgi:hypothetical protein